MCITIHPAERGIIESRRESDRGAGDLKSRPGLLRSQTEARAWAFWALSAQQLFHPGDQGRWLDIQRTSELAESSQRGLANAAFDLTDEGAVDVCTQRQRFLRNTGRCSLFAQHTAERRRHLIRSHCGAIIWPPEAFGPRYIVDKSISVRFQHESTWNAAVRGF